MSAVPRLRRKGRNWTGSVVCGGSRGRRKAAAGWQIRQRQVKEVSTAGLGRGISKPSAYYQCTAATGVMATCRTPSPVHGMPTGLAKPLPGELRSGSDGQEISYSREGTAAPGRFGGRLRSTCSTVQRLPSRIAVSARTSHLGWRHRLHAFVSSSIGNPQ